jgi:uncharacterized membrane protein
VGVDAARAVALIGMITFHIFPPTAPGVLAAVIETVISGRAAALFAVLAGVGIALGTGGRTPLTGLERRGAAAGLCVRAAMLFVLGLILHFALHPPVSVILDYYGIMFLVAIPLLGARPAVSALLAAACCVLGPVLSHLIRAHFPSLIPHEWLHDALGDLALAMVAGTFPVLPWMTYMLVGLVVGRLDLGRVRVGLGLLVGGTVLALISSGMSTLLLGPLGGSRSLALSGAGADALHRTMSGTTPTDSWWWLCLTAPHSSTPFDLAHTTGSSLAILGLCLLLARRFRRIVRLLASIGSIPLTLYTVHIILIGPAHAAEPEGSLFQLGLQLAVVVIIAAAVRRTGGRGPLETMLAKLAGAVRRGVTHGPRKFGPRSPSFSSRSSSRLKTSDSTVSTGSPTS